MLISLHILNYTLVDQLEIEFCDGMTAITGETGTGKSLVLDALAMALGGRADLTTIRQGQQRAEISALFDTTHNTAAKEWLLAEDFECTDPCILRRIYSTEGRSRGYINGRTCTMQQLKTLGERLIDIHSQHEHQSLLRRNTHRHLLDEYADAKELASQVRDAHELIGSVERQIEVAAHSQDAVSARSELLTFQVNELEHLDMQPGEFEQLESEQQRLTHAEQLLTDSQRILSLCEYQEDVNIRDSLARALGILNGLTYRPSHFDTIEELLRGSLIQVEEVVQELEREIDSFSADPVRLEQLNERMSVASQLARKHRVPPNALNGVYNSLTLELQELKNDANHLDTLKEQLDHRIRAYRKLAEKLRQKRLTAATKMAIDVNAQLASLAMLGADFRVAETLYKADTLRASGLEEIEFLIATNPGQPHLPLQKIASGGELSRVSLAIQVVAAEHVKIPTLVFDEVDVGIGGATADVVGRLLKCIGTRGQVISVTHQAQVAAHADHHYLTEKKIQKDSAVASIEHLSVEQRGEEIARMLGGSDITEKTRNHAKEMLTLARDA